MDRVWTWSGFADGYRTSERTHRDLRPRHGAVGRSLPGAVLLFRARFRDPALRIHLGTRLERVEAASGTSRGDREQPARYLARALHKGLIHDGNAWSEMQKQLNLTSHTYNEALADEVYTFVKTRALPCFQDLARDAVRWLNET